MSWKDKINKQTPLTSKKEQLSDLRKSNRSSKPIKKNFKDHIINSRSDMCYKVSGKDSTGRVAWYFVLIDRAKKAQFLKHKEGDSYDLEDYGEIIVSGYGKEIPKDVQEMLKDKYGFNNF